MRYILQPSAEEDSLFVCGSSRSSLATYMEAHRRPSGAPRQGGGGGHRRAPPQPAVQRLTAALSPREQRYRRRFDLAALSEASTAVESLRAALTASAASEEAARLEVSGLEKQLEAYRREEDGRFQHQLRQQSEQMRLRLRMGEMEREISLKEGAASSAGIDIQCLQQELARVEQRASEATAEMKEEKRQSEAAIAALHAAREREAEEHRQRLAEHQRQLHALRETMGQDRRVDPRMYLELLEPVYQRLADGLRHELERSNALGASWGAREAEEARAALARFEVQRDEEAAFRNAQARRREEKHQAQLESVKASAAKEVEELKDHLASLVSELQEKEAAARAAQQLVLDQLSAERTSFHTSLKRMQTQLAAARSEMARGGRVSSHLVSKVMAEWDKRRLVRVVIGWRAEVVRRQFMRSDAREEELKHSEQRLTNSSLFLAAQRWRHLELSKAFTYLRARCADERDRRPVRQPQSRGRPSSSDHGGQSETGERYRPRTSHRRTFPSASPGDASARGRVSTAAGGEEQRRVRRRRRESSAPIGGSGTEHARPLTPPPSLPDPPAPIGGSGTEHARLLTPPPSLPDPPSQIGGPSQLQSPPQQQPSSPADTHWPATATSGEGSASHGAESDERTAYLAYLKMCLRQQREPAPEVVEMGRAKGGTDQASLLALQIRTAEEQLGISASRPVPMLPPSLSTLELAI